jgi:Zn-dependent protease/CBS domain-containing protein
MFTSRLRLLRVRGIDINVDLSWLIVLGLLSWTMASNLREEDVQAHVAMLDTSAYWLLGLVTALAFFVCIVLHELGHALVAQQVDIPMRGITLFLFGGVAEMEDEPPSAGKEFLMAIAGPVVSAVLSGFFGLLAIAGIQLGWMSQVNNALLSLALINLAVLVFNLVPAFPLDGGRVFRAILWGATRSLRRATYWSSLLGQGFAWLLIVLGVANFFASNFLGGMWLVLIGLFLNGAAQSSYQQVVVRLALHGEPVRRFMNPNPITVPPSLDLRSWVNDFVYRYHHKTFPVVTADGELEGVITTAALGQIPQDEWQLHTVGEVMRRDLEDISVAPDVDALEALNQIRRTDWSRLLVTEGHRLVGLVSLKDLARFLQLKSELEGIEGDGRPRPTGSVPDRLTSGDRTQTHKV